jgi:hypothetical protein
MQIIDNRQNIIHFPDVAAKALERFAKSQHRYFMKYPSSNMSEKIFVKYMEWYWEHFARQITNHTDQTPPEDVFVCTSAQLKTYSNLVIEDYELNKGERKVYTTEEIATIFKNQ